ncbi:CAP domain-containing protein [Myxococcota bacterium]|nr:CAP domain-containing protein [Myxococcota bacterium]MBU1898955.1 CAP domain-containing protein [Myxococcota bacterium]
MRVSLVLVLSALVALGCVAEMSISSPNEAPPLAEQDRGAEDAVPWVFDGDAGANDAGGSVVDGTVAPTLDVPTLRDPCQDHRCGRGACVARGPLAECVCEAGAVLLSGVCVDACEAINCGPRGQCVEGACVCEAGGVLDDEGRCVDPVDPCEGYDCGALGVCQIEAGRAACQCQPQAALIGGRCVDPCQGFPCQGGECRVVEGGARCDCPPGTLLIGDACVDPCAGISCGGGACVVGSCECFEGFLLQGGVCVDPCATARCDPGACVFDAAGRPSCQCPAGYYAEGLACLDPCAQIACAGGHVCRVVDQAPRCVCPDGQQTLADGTCGVPNPCDGVTCEGHGVCQVVNQQAQCACDEGYLTRGAHCVEANDPCSGQACSGHGECLDRDGTPVCACERGFTPSSRLGLDCVPTGEVCRGGTIDYDVDGDGSNEDWFEPAEDECFMYELVNLTRATHDHEGQPECFTPLSYSVIWSAHARNHSMQMRDQGGLFHADHPGGQNCAGPSHPEQSMSMYMTGPSEPHCPDLSHHCNIMRCRFSAIGIGYVDRWNTQNFF